MKNIVRLLGIIILCAVSCVVPGAEPGGPWQETTALIRDQSLKDTMSLTETFISIRKSSVRTLVDILQDPKLPKQNKLASASILGELRAPEAVDALMKHLTLSPDVVLEKTHESMFPCYYALVRIGTAASRNALIVLQDEEDDLRKQLLTLIINRVEGKFVAAFLITSELEKNKTENEQKNLRFALAALSE